MPEKKTVWEIIAGSFKTRAFKVGTYSIFSSLIVIAIAVAVVLAVSKLPAKYTQFDMTNQGLYSLSEQTKKLCSGLTDDVTMYWLIQSQQGAVKNSIQLRSLLSRYENLNSHIVVKEVDPVENPAFVSKYTSDLRYNNSVIVVSGSRSKFVDYPDIFTSDTSNYYTTGQTTQTFSGESALTGAIDYVTSTNLPKMYSLSGHGEGMLPGSISNGVANQNILTASLSLITSKTVPSDCACLFIYTPASDISSDEMTIIQKYLQGGGHMLLITDYKKALPNLQALMANYGTTLNKGLVVDTAAGL